MNKETRYKILSEIVDKPGDAYDLIETLREGQKLSEEAIELNKELSRERIKKLRHEKLIERKKIGWLIFAYILIMSQFLITELTTTGFTMFVFYTLFVHFGVVAIKVNERYIKSFIGRIINRIIK